MTIDDEIRDGKIQYNINKEQQKYQYYHLEKLMNINILQAKKYYLLVKVDLQKKLSLHILHWKKLLKNKEKYLKINEENKLRL